MQKLNFRRFFLLCNCDMDTMGRFVSIERLCFDTFVTEWSHVMNDKDNYSENRIRKTFENIRFFLLYCVITELMIFLLEIRIRLCVGRVSVLNPKPTLIDLDLNPALIRGLRIWIRWIGRIGRIRIGISSRLRIRFYFDKCRIRSGLKIQIQNSIKIGLYFYV